MDWSPLEEYIQRFSAALHQLHTNYKVVLPGLLRCATCGRDRLIVNLHSMVAPEDRYMLVAVCDECERAKKVDTALVSQYHPDGVTHIGAPDTWESAERVLLDIRQETGLYYFNHPLEEQAMRNGGPAYQSPLARAYLAKAAFN